GRSCRGESPLAETGERSIEPRLTAREQRQAWPRRSGLLDQRSDSFADQCGLARAAGSRDPPQRALEIVWKVHGRLDHAIHSIIHGRAGSLGSRTHRVARMHETEFHRLIALAVFVGTYVGL